MWFGSLESKAKSFIKNNVNLTYSPKDRAHTELVEMGQVIYTHDTYWVYRYRCIWQMHICLIPYLPKNLRYQTFNFFLKIRSSYLNLHISNNFLKFYNHVMIIENRTLKNQVFLKFKLQHFFSTCVNFILISLMS